MNRTIDFTIFSQTDYYIAVPEQGAGLTKIRFLNLGEVFATADIENEFERYAENINSQSFLNPYGIHGIGHAKRVLFLCLTLSFLNNLDESDKQILADASLFHDIGRVNDEDCELHGYFSFKKIIESRLVRNSNPMDTEVLKYVVENHCTPDKNAFRRVNNCNIANKVKAVRLLKLFKDADALDRVRTNDLDMNYLRFTHSKLLLEVSQQLSHLIG